jgi:chemotaxis protein methyltransferase CheR
MSPTDPPPAPAVTDEEFRRLAEFIYRRTGMVFTEAKRYYVDRRLSERMTATGRRSFSAYFALLRAGIGGEVEQLINSFTVNETYFYREEHQFKCLTDNLLPDVTGRKQPGATLRIWSVPCSTGEEAYSIAMWLLENWAAVDAYDVEIVGSDIDTRVLEAATEGRYGDRALMRLRPALVARYFERTGPDQHRIIADLRDSVRFTPVNLIEQSGMRDLGRFDVVFCRNVLIYFDEASRRVAAENLYDALVPGGYICLGHTESMSRISPLFRACRFADAIVYQKPLEGQHV